MHYQIHVLDVQNKLKNYIWIIEDIKTHQVIVIDPTEAKIVIDYCQKNRFILTQIWITHWHPDHTTGIDKLVEHYSVPVYGPSLELDKIPLISHALHDNDQFKFNHLIINVIETPGHTLGHISYFIEQIDSLFCGDTLFSQGCGRVFEGTFEQMYNSLRRLSALPLQTKVYCSHEYTESNIEFALSVDPHNVLLQKRAKEVCELVQNHQITLPSTIELELETNPFLRAKDIKEFSQLRTRKDNF